MSAEKLIKCLLGYATWCSEKNGDSTGGTEIDTGQQLANIIHDLAEWKKNHKEKWFSPRTSGYEKYCRI